MTTGSYTTSGDTTHSCRRKGRPVMDWPGVHASWRSTDSVSKISMTSPSRMSS
jgi:hypothetical protein